VQRGVRGVVARESARQNGTEEAPASSFRHKIGLVRIAPREQLCRQKRLHARSRGRGSISSRFFAPPEYAVWMFFRSFRVPPARRKSGNTPVRARLTRAAAIQAAYMQTKYARQQMAATCMRDALFARARCAVRYVRNARRERCRGRRQCRTGCATQTATVLL